MLGFITAEVLIFIFGLTLNIFALPILLDSEAAVPRIQSAMTAISLAVISAAYMSIGLMLPSISVSIGAVVWTLAFIYRPTGGKWLGVGNIIGSIK